MKKFVFIIVIFLIAISAVLYVVHLGRLGSKTLVVPDDYATIGWAVGNATAGDTVYVRSGTYNESVSVDKPLSLIGEDMSNTIILSEGTRGRAHVTASDTYRGSSLFPKSNDRRCSRLRSCAREDSPSNRRD